MGTFFSQQKNPWYEVESSWVGSMSFVTFTHAKQKTFNRIHNGHYRYGSCASSFSLSRGDSSDYSVSDTHSLAGSNGTFNHYAFQGYWRMLIFLCCFWTTSEYPKEMEEQHYDTNCYIRYVRDLTTFDISLELRITLLSHHLYYI